MTVDKRCSTLLVLRIQNRYEKGRLGHRHGSVKVEDRSQAVLSVNEVQDFEDVGPYPKSYQPQGDRQLGTLHNSDFVNITFTVFLGI